MNQDIVKPIADFLEAMIPIKITEQDAKVIIMMIAEGLGEKINSEN